MLTMKRVSVVSGIVVALAGLVGACGTNSAPVPLASVSAGTAGGCYTSPYATGYTNGYYNNGYTTGYGGYGANGGCQAGYIMSGTMCCPSGYNTSYGYANGYANTGYGITCPYPTVYYPNYGCR